MKVFVHPLESQAQCQSSTNTHKNQYDQSMIGCYQCSLIEFYYPQYNVVVGKNSPVIPKVIEK